jgi:hypothetical protein
MNTLFDLDPSSREYLDKMNMIENLVWDITKIAYPVQFIEPDIVSQVREKVLGILRKGISR